MLEPRARQAIARLVTAVLAVKPVTEGVSMPIRVVPVGQTPADPRASWPRPRWDELDQLLARVTRQAGVAGLTLSRTAAPGDLQVFERVISERLALAELPETVPARPEEWLADVDQISAETMAGSFDVFFHKEEIVSADQLPLNVYAAGSGREVVVLVPACGLPAALAESWMRFLARDRPLLAWESRGLFGAVGGDGDYAVDTAAQVADLFAVMDHYGADRAHLIGLCGGAVIALAAAASQPDRICSLSLWHGAYEFGSGSPRTRFQNDLIELMGVAARSRATARSVQATFGQVALTNMPAEVAHLVLYPYTSPELFYRYCRLNGALARTDVEPYLPRVWQPTLVVTSQDDETAHPQGSRQVAAGLPNARLRVEPHGDHASLFRPDCPLIQVAVDFITEQRPPAPP
jgi:pimeloyl-ACP methyl ester carboxylesterase